MLLLCAGAAGGITPNMATLTVSLETHSPELPNPAATGHGWPAIAQDVAGSDGDGPGLHDRNRKQRVANISLISFYPDYMVKTI